MSKTKLKPSTHYEYRVEINKLNKAMKDKKARLDACLFLYQETCKHHDIFLGDPSGNGDSYYECVRCGRVCK